MNSEPLPAFYPRLCRAISHPLKRVDKLGPAIGISATIERVLAQENIAGARNFRPSQREGKEDGVAFRCIRHRDVAGSQIKRDGFVVLDLHRTGKPPS